MTVSAIFVLAGLAIIDALNPFSIAAMAFLLSTDRPVHRGVTFIIGTFAVYFLAGVVLLEGWLIVIKTLLPSLPGWILGSLEMAAGAAAGAAGIDTWRRAAKDKSAPGPSNLSTAATFAFALVSTLSDLPTAIPYFAAASQIAAAGSDPLTRYAWLVAYNMVYVAPLAAMLALRSALGANAESVLARVRRAVDWSFAKLLPPGLVIAGAALLIDGAMRVWAFLA
jgi:hypothetical protein